jgi:hypothetical protein
MVSAGGCSTGALNLIGDTSFRESVIRLQMGTHYGVPGRGDGRACVLVRQGCRVQDWIELGKVV